MLQPNETYLEDRFGHLTPDEVKQSEVMGDRDKAHIAQLQIRALGTLGLGSNELRLWLDVYGHALGQTDYS